ncbi:cytochrome c556 [Bacillus ectoiniformans]|uniref:YhcN/YlaJ family sporulation lipoprotein n=1 Tax=Bacillus ectoiniformans TaxID=1494429 RepID=UPI00195E0A0D|nr:YhcN/YlaJ family sporulation lipoprotein [Bacillus ectoiniformans]MBM7647521.1 cytochrome c556 [Bacillus ectoiniformans]
MKALICLIMAVALAGCMPQEEHGTSRYALMKKTDPEPLKLSYKGADAEEVKKEVAKIDDIYDVAVIKANGDVLVAYKVKHLHRFRMKQIEKNLTERLDKQYHGQHFVVSSDYKIFLEAIRLQEDLDAKHITKKEAKKRFEDILKLKKERT